MSENRPLLPSTPGHGSPQLSSSWLRNRIRRVLGSHASHISILILISLDVACIFADIFLSLFRCERGGSSASWDTAQDALSLASLIFSCLFMLELSASLFAFSWGYLKSWWNCFDATIIIAGLAIDLLNQGSVQEVASLIVLGRLWRVIKIIEEFGSAARQGMEEVQSKVESLEGENRKLREELEDLKKEVRRANGDSSES